MGEKSEYVLEPLCQGADFTLYRGREHGNQMPILAVAAGPQLVHTVLEWLDKYPGQIVY
jgi:hypothetical protein